MYFMLSKINCFPNNHFSKKYIICENCIYLYYLLFVQIQLNNI